MIVHISEEKHMVTRISVQPVHDELWGARSTKFKKSIENSFRTMPTGFLGEVIHPSLRDRRA